MSQLGQVKQHIECSNHEQALTVLLSLWDQTRSPAVAAVIECVSSDIERSLAPIVADGPDGHTAWCVVARAGRAIDVPRLCAALAIPQANTLGGRVDLLLSRPADPRIASAMLAFIQNPPTTSSSNFPIWSSIFRALETKADPRMAAGLADRLSQAKGKSQFWPKLYQWVEKLQKKLPVARELSSEDLLTLAEISSIVQSRLALPWVNNVVHAAKTAVESSPSFSIPTLEDALPLVRVGNIEGALTVLTGVWALIRSEAIASRIQALSALTPGASQPIEGNSPKKAAANWLTLEADKRLVDLPRLLSSILDGGLAAAELAIRRLEAWPPDPRIGIRMGELFELDVAGERDSFWRAVAEVWARSASHQTLGIIRPHADQEGRWPRQVIQRRAARRGLEVAGTGFAEEPMLSHTDVDLLKRIDDSLLLLADRPTPEKQERALLRIIDENWSDEGPIQVYADFLAERNHPRAELIAMQMATPAKPEVAAKKLAAFTKKYARALLDPLGEACNLLTGRPEFERGLPSSIPIELRSEAQGEAVVGHPLLCGVRTVHLDNNELTQKHAERILCHPIMKRVREVHGVSVPVFGALCRQPKPMGIERIGLLGDAEDLARLQLEFADPQASQVGLSTLRVIELNYVPRPGRWFFEAPHLAGLREVREGSRFASEEMLMIADWLQALPDSTPIVSLKLKTSQLDVYIRTVSAHLDTMRLWAEKVYPGKDDYLPMLLTRSEELEQIKYVEVSGAISTKQTNRLKAALPWANFTHLREVEREEW